MAAFLTGGKEMTNPITPNMLLAEPVDLPDIYRETVTDFLVQYWRDRQWEMMNHWGFTNLQMSGKSQLLRTMLAEKLAIIAAYADGQDTVDRVGAADTIQDVIERLFAIGSIVYVIPSEFWETEIGWMILTAQLRAQGDDLMTITRAAELAGRSINAISGMVARGTLTSYRDPSENNPQKNRRVLRSEIEALDEQK